MPRGGAQLCCARLARGARNRCTLSGPRVMGRVGIKDSEGSRALGQDTGMTLHEISSRPSEKGQHRRAPTEVFILRLVLSVGDMTGQAASTSPTAVPQGGRQECTALLGVCGNHVNGEGRQEAQHGPHPMALMWAAEWFSEQDCSQLWSLPSP